MLVLIFNFVILKLIGSGIMVKEASDYSMVDMTSVIRNSSESSSSIYIVERIMSHQYEKGGRIMFKVKWENFDVKESTWEPLCNLGECKELVEEYCRRKKLNFGKIWSEGEEEGAGRDKSLDELKKIQRKSKERRGGDGLSEHRKEKQCPADISLIKLFDFSSSGMDGKLKKVKKLKREILSNGSRFSVMLPERGKVDKSKILEVVRSATGVVDHTIEDKTLLFRLVWSSPEMGEKHGRKYFSYDILQEANPFILTSFIKPFIKFN